MVAVTDTFSTWLAQAQIAEARLTTDQRGVLQAAFRFRQQQGDDYYSTRLLSHFLLHCGSGLKVAQVARLLGLSRPTASRQQALSSKQTVQQAHHRLDGRPYGKLLPRYAGPIAQFLLTQPQATRADLIDFVARTFDVRVSRIALYKFLKKYGLDSVTNAATATATAAATPSQTPLATTPTSAAADTSPPPANPILVATLPAAAAAPPFCPNGRSTRARS
jgi:transposase